MHIGFPVARSAGSRPQSRSSRRLYGVAGLLALALTAGCAAYDNQGAAAGLDKARDVFSVGYDGMADYYIDPVDLRRLTVHGLAALKSIDGSLSVTEAKGQLTVAAGSKVLKSFPLPTGSDAYRWARFTTDVVTEGRAHSTLLREASAEAIYKTVFEAEFADLDPFSRYASAEAARQQRANREGFGGIGITIAMTEAGVTISSVLPETPASRAGLKDGDVIVAADGKALAGLSSTDVLERLRGRIDSSITLAILRGASHLDVPLTRARIIPVTVTVKHEGGTAHIRVTGFNQRTSQQVEEAVATALGTYGPGLKGMILDLRGNPGGLLDQAVHVSDLFLSEGQILTTEGRHPRARQSYKATDGDITGGLPLIVLMNGGSASAAEIVAAALQDNRRALVVGSTSYGKGSVQTVLRLPNDGEMTITWARMFGPAGYPLHRLGVVPSICTSQYSGEASVVLEDLRRGAAEPGAAFSQRGRFVQQGEAAGAEAARRLCPARSGDGDIELKVARQILEDSSLFALASRTSQVALTP